MRKIVLTDEMIDCLDQARIHRGWTKEDDSEALIQASLYVIENLMNEVSQNYRITLADLEKWEEEKKIEILDRIKYNAFKKKCEANSQEFNPSLIFIDCLSIGDDLIREFVIRAKGFTLNSLRSCTEKKFKKPETKPKTMVCNILEVYCSIFDINLDDIESDTERIKFNDLYNILSLFNYSDMMAFIDKFSYERLRQKVIHIPSSSLFYPPWLTRRLELKINDLGHRTTKKIVFDLADKNKEWTFFNLTSYLFASLKDDNINKILDKNNVLLIFKNVDQKDRAYLDEVLIRELWQSLCSQTAPSKGFLLMLWIDQGNVNDWGGNPHNISEIIHPLAKVSSFCKQDFEDFLPHLGQKFQLSNLRDPCYRAQECDRLWQESEQGQIEATLKAFYKTFQCNLVSETRWLNYP